MTFLKNSLAWSLGGLPKPYYFKQIAIGIAIFMVVFGMSARVRPLGRGELILAATNIMLYPYSRFVCDSLKEMLFGKKNGGTGFPTWLMLGFSLRLFSLIALIIVIAFKLFILLFFFFSAPIIGTIGLIWLYVMHAMEAKQYGEPL